MHWPCEVIEEQTNSVKEANEKIKGMNIIERQEVMVLVRDQLNKETWYEAYSYKLRT